MAKRKTHEEFIKKFKESNRNDITVLGKYTTWDGKIDIQCKTCNHIWSSYPNHILKSKTHCPECNKQYKHDSQALTQDEFVEKVKIVNPFIEVIGNYINNKTKILFKCNLCNYEWNASPFNILNGCGCTKCKKRKISEIKSLPYENFEKRANLESKHIKINKNDYVNMTTKINCTCEKCGYQWMTLPHLLCNGSSCPKCAGVIKKTHEEFIHEINSINPNIDIIGKYISNNTLIKCKCKIDGFVWDAIPTNLLRGSGCIVCFYRNQRKTNDDFVNEVKAINDNVEIVGKYINSKTKIKSNCKICGHTWYPSPDSLLRGSGCPKCNFSRGENYIYNFLKRNKIDFKTQKKFNDLVGTNNGKLSYDFYLPNNNTLIEYQGEQHYKPIDYYGGEKHLKKQDEHDKRKREYAEHNKIKLIEIPYWDFNNIEKILSDELGLIS